MHRHGFRGRKLSLKKEPRELLLRNLATSLILHEKIKTTLPKAKEVQPIVEKMITLAKEDNLSNTRRLHSYFLDTQAVLKLRTEIVGLYRDRKGGYTRITKYGYRNGDNAKMAYIELIDVEKLDRKPQEGKKPKKEPAPSAKKKSSPGKKVTKKEKGK